MEGRPKSQRRRSSVSMMGGTNPLTNGDADIEEETSPMSKIESVAGCKLIDKNDFDEIMDVLTTLE